MQNAVNQLKDEDSMNLSSSVLKTTLNVVSTTEATDNITM